MSEDDDVFIDKPEIDQDDDPRVVENGMTKYKPRLSEILKDQKISAGLKNVLLDNDKISLGKVIGSGRRNSRDTVACQFSTVCHYLFTIIVFGHLYIITN